MWKIYATEQMSEEQKQYFMPPKHHHINSVIMVAHDILDNYEICDCIVIGEITPQNKEQAEIICAALNKAGAPVNVPPTRNNCI